MKTAVLKWKYLKYIFWLSPVLIVAGLTAGAVGGQWDAVPLILIGVGVAIAILWLAYISNALPGFFRQRSTRAGTNALVATLAVIVILGLVNFLGVRYSQRWDLTENQIFTLAPESIEVVQEFQEPIQVRIFDVLPNPLDEELLESYRQYNPQFSYTYTDPQANPALARQFGVSSPGEVYVERGDDPQLVQVINAEERLSERRLTTTLANLLNPVQPRVYVLQGHGERPLEPGEGSISEAIAALRDSNYLPEPLTLAEAGRIPDDANVVILASPQRPLLEFELEALDTYLDGEGGLLVLADPILDPAAELDEGLADLLAEWGVTLSNLVVLDPEGQASGLGPAVPIITNYGNHPITASLDNGISFYPVAQPIGLNEQPDVEAVTLLITSDRTQAQTIGADGQLQPAPDPAFQGEMTLGAALSRPVAEETEAESAPEPSGDSAAEDSDATEEPDAAAETEASAESNTTEDSATEESATEDSAAEESATEESATEESATEDSATEESTAGDSTTEEPATEDNATASEEVGESGESRLVVIGNSSFITDGLLNQQLNGDVFLNSVSWLSQTDNQPLTIRVKELENRRILLSGQTQLLLILASVIALPVLGFVLALVIWWRRR